MINDFDFMVKFERIINNEGMGILKYERKLRYNIWRILYFNFFLCFKMFMFLLLMIFLGFILKLRLFIIV